MNTTPDTARLTRRNKLGLGLAGLLGLADVIAILLIPSDSSGQPGPPVEVMVLGVVLGVITLVAVAVTARTASRLGARITAGSRILSMITALPAFFVPGVPADLVGLAAVNVVLTALSVWLVLSRSGR